MLTKPDLIARVQKATGGSKTDATVAVETVFNELTNGMKQGGVRIVGFGTFEVHDRAASEGRNPRTGEKIQIAAAKHPKFKPGKALRDAVNLAA